MFLVFFRAPDIVLRLLVVVHGGRLIINGDGADGSAARALNRVILRGAVGPALPLTFRLIGLGVESELVPTDETRLENDDMLKLFRFLHHPSTVTMVILSTALTYESSSPASALLYEIIQKRQDLPMTHPV